MIALGMTLLSCVPSPDATTVWVEQIEINHRYDCEGQLQFVQVIFWDICPAGERHVRSWRFLNTMRVYGRTAIMMTQHGVVVVRSRRPLLQTWTQYDPEIEDRERLPLSRRAGIP